MIFITCKHGKATKLCKVIREQLLVIPDYRNRNIRLEYSYNPSNGVILKCNDPDLVTVTMLPDDSNYLAELPNAVLGIGDTIFYKDGSSTCRTNHTPLIRLPEDLCDKIRIQTNYKYTHIYARDASEE